jgi:hypothetical protein
MSSKYSWVLVVLVLGGGLPTRSAEPGKAPHFMVRDTKTVGKWKGMYGRTAAWIAVSSDLEGKQAGYKLEVKDNQTYTWSEDGADDARAPQAVKAGDKAAATCWYADDSFSLTVTPPEVTTPEQRAFCVTIYVVDWDHQGRAQEAKVDGEDKVQAISATEADGGVYVTWWADQAFTLHMTKTDGPNAVISAVFVDPVPTIAVGGPAK